MISNQNNMTIDKATLYIEHFNKAGIATKNFISDSVVLNSIKSALDLHFSYLEEKEDRSESIKNSLNLYLLDLKEEDETVEDICEILDIEDISEFFDVLILKQDYKTLLSKLFERTRELEPVETKQPETISHTDILNEIENPTPSIKGLGLKPANTNTQNQVHISSTTDNTISNNTAQTAPTSTTPVLPPNLENNLTMGGFSLHTPVNPAQKIADKLNQNLQTPSVSIPKEVYVPKKLDPYKEPLE